MNHIICYFVPFFVKEFWMLNDYQSNILFAVKFVQQIDNVSYIGNFIFLSVMFVNYNGGQICVDSK